MRAGTPPPVAFFIGAELSLPIQTPQTRSAVKPTNQASWKSWVVPVLPALGRSSSRAALPVPVVTVSIITLVMAALSAGDITAALSAARRRYSNRPALVLIDRIAKGATRVPPLAKGA